MVSKRNEGGVVNEGQLEKIMVSGRVPKYVKQYAKDRDISISDLIMVGFDSYREQDVAHAFERLSYHENRVLHWKQIVIHAESACNTKHEICNTIKETFVSQNRGHPEDKKKDKFWLTNRVLELQAKGIPITIDELYSFCVDKKMVEVVR